MCHPVVIFKRLCWENSYIETCVTISNNYCADLSVLVPVLCMPKTKLGIGHHSVKRRASRIDMGDSGDTAIIWLAVMAK